jgi:hypothetical protein
MLDQFISCLFRSGQIRSGKVMSFLIRSGYFMFG